MASPVTGTSDQDTLARRMVGIAAIAKARGLSLPVVASGVPWPPLHVPDPEGRPAPFHPGHLATWESRRRLTAMLAGTQAGKTRFGPFWLRRLIYGDDEVEGAGGGDYLAVTAAYDLFKLNMLPALLAVFRDIYGVGRYWAGDRVIELRPPDRPFVARKATDPMWGRIILRSAHAEGGLESSTAKGAWLDEAGQTTFDSRAWAAIKRRMAIHSAPVLITTTLYSRGWLKTDVHDAATRDGTAEIVKTTHERGAEMIVTDHPGTGWSDIRLVQFDSIINPTFSYDDYRDAMETMPADDFGMFWRGLFGKPRSLIYDVFDDEFGGRHVCSSFVPPPNWPRALGVDPIGERTAAVWLAWDPEARRLHAYREYYEPFGRTTPGHAAAILNLTGGERVARWCGGSPSERQARADWASAGVPLEEPPFGDLWAGIDRVYQLLATDALVIHDSCPHLISELGSYSRMEVNGQLTARIQDKDHYHLADALRYICAAVTTPREGYQVIYAPVRIGRW